MRKIIHTILLVPIFFSCNIVNHKRFTYYKQPPIKPLAFSTIGLYYNFTRSTFTRWDPERKYWAHVYFFYEDGSFYTTSIGVKDSSVNDLKMELPNDYHQFVENNPDATGAFKIVGDTLKVERFIGTAQRGIYATDVMEQYFILNRNTNSITLIKNYCKWCAAVYSSFDKKTGIENTKVPVEYNFMPLQTMPDSSKMMYKKKRWYKDEIKKQQQ